ncbi:MAG: tRNA epoxyqueuosine(34) reductase QueG [Phycisphaerae bacterium]
MSPGAISEYIKSLAATLGFDRCGIARAEPIGRSAYLRDWRDGGRCGSMEYLRRHFVQRADPSAMMDGAKSIVVVAFLYHQRAPVRSNEADRRRGRVAMYAWGDDYHKVIKAKLFDMIDRMRAELPEPFNVKVCVDTTPLLEREVAAAAGIGWIGKNTLVLDHQLGSYFFLGALVTTLELTPDKPLPDRCGTCTACLDACPTNAFPAPYEMDASRCISYLTIEHRGRIPESLGGRMGEWIFGCDVCQQVCPYNRRAPQTREPRFAIRSPGPEPVLDEILRWSVDDYRRQLRGSAMKRATLDMLKRNARIATNNVEHTCERHP